ncbi:class I SAM-dependent methyltransferase [Sphingomonas phyllosphaerae]|uniref:class I SAM-dependent methyltransferase n=1 Tax=Sphingomonas phyllosphaerae TaxID=257003 RepID=UPI002413C1FB|nr:methyltransferase domain-containing protein [Sphingomonas phyllosphaerae]
MNRARRSVLSALSRICPAGTHSRLELLATAGTGRARADRRAGMSFRPAGSASGDEPASGFWSDAARFLVEWSRHPYDIAAIAPSGRVLASLITCEIDGASGPVLELGPGTGAFTRALTRRGVAKRDLTLVERSPTFARLLKDRFPASTVLNIDAADLHLGRRAAAQPFGAVVCGLGLRNMTSREVEGIVRASFTALRPAGSFYLITYGSRCSVPDDVLDRLGLIAEKVGSTLRNLPPASVYRLQRVGMTG